jgi:hypothetical protein
MKYFGKTIKDPTSYMGSGKYWKRYIKKYGIEYINTIWISEPFTNKLLISEYALLISEHWDIVNSKGWANLKVENGLDGGSDLGHKKSEQGRLNITKASQGSRNGMFGKTQTIESKKKMSYTKSKTPSTTCPYCNTTGKCNMLRYHFNNCKYLWLLIIQLYLLYNID